MSALPRCPTCGRPFQPDEAGEAPFCSQRCRQVDLHRWLDERYALPVERDEDPPDPGQDPPSP